MGGNKGDRKSYKATSSAKAAEALAAKGGGGFGGFSGVRPVAGFGFGAAAAAVSAAAPSAADPVELSAQLDGDLAQCLRHMSKRDTTTKMKALQTLKELIPQKSTADLALLLQPWAYQFKKLLLDPSKAVRAEAATIMAAVGSSVGKALLPQLKGVLGPWYLACFDPYPDAADAAKRSLQDVFPAKKQDDALVYCRSEVLAHIVSCLASTPQTLGDPRKDTPEELEERHERVTAASLAAAAALLTALQQQAQQDASAEPAAADASPVEAALAEVQGKVHELLAAPGFLKKHLGSKSVVVRRAGYGLVRSLCAVAPQLLCDCQAAAAPVVLGALQEKDASNHPAMWEMLLAYVQSQQPGCWSHVNMQKAFAPRLLALLRHGCYGSAATSLPALLPLVALLPRQLAGFQPLLLLDSVLEAVWAGLQQGMGSQAGRSATAASYQEVLSWGLRNAGTLATAGAGGEDTSADSSNAAAGEDDTAAAAVAAACEQLSSGHFHCLINQAVGGVGGDAELAAGVVQEVLLGQCGVSTPAVTSDGEQQQQQQQAAAVPVQLQVLLAAISAAAQKHLAAAVLTHSGDTNGDVAAAGADSLAVCGRLQQLFDALSSSSAQHSQLAAATLAESCCAALLPLLQAGKPLPAAASQLLARLIREYPAAAAAGCSGGAAAGAQSGNSTTAADGSITALVRLGLTSCSAGGQLSAADLELLLSCIAGADDVAAAWGSVITLAAAQAGAAGTSSIAGWQFLDALLREYASSPSQGGVPGDWSLPELDSLVLQLTQQLAATGSSGSSTGGDSWGSAKGQVAAASLLGCCLGANEQQMVLLSSAALETALADIAKCLTAALGQQQQQQEQQQQQQQQEQQAVSVQLRDAAAICISALRMIFASCSHTSSNSSSNSSIWQQQPQQVVQLLVLLAQLSWGGQQELVLPSAEQDEAEEEDGSVSDSSSSASSGGESSMEFEDVQSDVGTDEPGGVVSGAGNGSKASAVAAAGDSKSAWDALQQAASRVWGADLLSSALDELAACAGQQLVQQLEQLLVQGISEASRQAAAAAADSAAGGGASAAAEAGLRWGSRAAAVLTGLDGRQQQQQQLVQQLLSAAGMWRQWCNTTPSRQAPSHKVDASSSITGSSAGGIEDPVHSLMVIVSSVLVLQVGCSVLLPLQSSSHNTTTYSDSTTSSMQPWLLLELLCTSMSLTEVPAAGGAGGQEEEADGDAQTGSQPMQLLHCVCAAALAAQQYLLSNAAKSSSRAVAARSLLTQVLGVLLSASQQPVSANSGTACRVYCRTLVTLLQQAVLAMSTHPSAQQQLLPVLQAFSSSTVAAAASNYMQPPMPDSSSDTCTPAWVLVAILEVLAAAFRFTGEACVTAAGLSQLSVSFVNKALALEPAAFQGSGGSNNSSDHDVQLELLQLAVACFPVQYDRQQRPAHHQHSHQQQRQLTHAANKPLQLSVGSSTAVERQALTALLRHSCSNSSSSAAVSTGELLCRLQLCCIGYCWPDMAAAEWHIVLRDSQARLSATRRDFERAASTLAGAACTAAQQLTAAVVSDDVMTPAMAIEVLRKLARKGLLQRQAGVTSQLLAAAQQAVAGLSLPMLELGLQLLAAVLQLQQQIQAAGRAPQLDLALGTAWRELLAMLMGLGAAVAVATSCGPAGAAVLMQCLEGQATTWQLLSNYCAAGPDKQEAVGKVLAAADERAELLGVDSVSCCIALLQAPMLHQVGHQQQHHQQAKLHVQQQGTGCSASALARQASQPLQQMAWELLLHPASLSRITHAAAAASKGDEAPEYGVNDDAATHLVTVGLRPEMAAALTNPKPWQVHLLHWALLLGHIAQLGSLKSSVAQRTLTQALRDVPELVPELLERVVSLMGLGASSKGAAAAVESAAAVDAGFGETAGMDAEAVAPAGAGPGLSAAAQVQLSAKLQQLGAGSAAAALAGEVWAFNTALRSIGLPLSHSSWRLLAAAVYRGVLQQLPASARLWFSDLRDRSRIAAVEAYTTKFESPALLAAEFAAIKRDAAGASGEVGGSCSFKVRASPAAREVTAVLEIEDGATLELQVKLPAAAPLKAAEVECRNKVGIKDGRLRKWLLSIAVFLRNQNQGILDAISMWKANLDQEFAGVEPCLVCMCVISTVNGQLPRLSCRHCHVCFHPACLYRWFRSSGKSNCVHCQNPW